MPSQQNINKVQQLSDEFKKIHGFILANYQGLTVAEITELRLELAKVNANIRVLSNRLTKIALHDVKIEGLDEFLSGPTAVVFDFAEFISSAKIVSKFCKDHEKLRLKAGFFEGKIISKENIEAIASLPSQKVLLTQIAVGLQAPLVKLVWALKHTLSSLALVLKQVADKGHKDS